MHTLAAVRKYAPAALLAALLAACSDAPAAPQPADSPPVPQAVITNCRTEQCKQGQDGAVTITSCHKSKTGYVTIAGTTRNLSAQRRTVGLLFEILDTDTGTRLTVVTTSVADLAPGATAPYTADSPAVSAPHFGCRLISVMAAPG